MQATTDSTQSHTDMERERGDDVCSGTSHRASVRDGGSESRAASRSIASRRTAVAGRDQLTRHTRNAQGSVASRISRSSQSAWWQGALCVGNYLRGASASSQRSSSRSVTSRSSTINSRRPPPEFFIHPSSSADAQSVHSSTSMSLYTSSSHSTPILSDLYDAQFCSDRVTNYTDCFISGFQIPDTPSKRILIEDELGTTYRRFYHPGAEQVEFAMKETYQYHVDLLAATLDAREAQRLRGGTGDVADNLEIDAVIQQPENNNRNDRAILYIPCSSQNSSSSHQ